MNFWVYPIGLPIGGSTSDASYSVHWKKIQPLDTNDASYRKEVMSLKNLYIVDCTWSTCQVLLWFMIDIVNMTLLLPLQQETCFSEILSAIPRTQKRIVGDNWHQRKYTRAWCTPLVIVTIPPWSPNIIQPYLGSHAPYPRGYCYNYQGCTPGSGIFPLDGEGPGAAPNLHIRASAAPPNPGLVPQCFRIHVLGGSPPRPGCSAPDT